MFKRVVTLLVIISFILSCSRPVYAQEFSINQLPEPGTMVSLSTAYEPVLIKGLKINPTNPLALDFIVTTGNTQLTAQDPELKEESEKLIKYFFAALTLPEKDVWVNLSPYEKDRIVPQSTGDTEMGRDMLAQDYILKQITASLIYPEKRLGKDFWNKVYTESYQRFGSTQIPVNTFNKVWIVADKASVYEAKDTVFVVDSHLKVMLDEDYTALNKHQPTQPINDTHAIGNQIIREIVLPALEKEVNEGKNFANLRQIFHSLILAKWYKETLKTALLNQVYSNKNKVAGVDVADKTIKEQIYQQYLRAYKKGVFNYIKEDIDQTTQQPIPRKYFSGGVSSAMIVRHATVIQAIRSFKRLVGLIFLVGSLATSSVGAPFSASAINSTPLARAGQNAAMTVSQMVGNLVDHREKFLSGKLTDARLLAFYTDDRDLVYSYESGAANIHAYIKQLEAKGVLFPIAQADIINLGGGILPQPTAILYNAQTGKLTKPELVPAEGEAAAGLHIFEKSEKNIIYLVYVPVTASALPAASKKEPGAVPSANVRVVTGNIAKSTPAPTPTVIRVPLAPAPQPVQHKPAAQPPSAPVATPVKIEEFKVDMKATPALNFENFIKSPGGAFYFKGFTWEQKDLDDIWSMVIEPKEKEEEVRSRWEAKLKDKKFPEELRHKASAFFATVRAMHRLGIPNNDGMVLKTIRFASFLATKNEESLKRLELPLIEQAAKEMLASINFAMASELHVTKQEAAVVGKIEGDPKISVRVRLKNGWILIVTADKQGEKLRVELSINDKIDESRSGSLERGPFIQALADGNMAGELAKLGVKVNGAMLGMGLIKRALKIGYKRLITGEKVNPQEVDDIRKSLSAILDRENGPNQDGQLLIHDLFLMAERGKSPPDNILEIFAVEQRYPEKNQEAPLIRMTRNPIITPTRRWINKNWKMSPEQRAIIKLAIQGDTIGSHTLNQGPFYKDGSDLPKPTPVLSIRGKRILIAEDNPVDLRNLKRKFVEEGAIVETFENGDHAYARLIDPMVHFDLVVTDNIMPGLHGEEIIRRVIKIKPDQQFIMWTLGDSDRKLRIRVGAQEREIEITVVRKEAKAVIEAARKLLNKAMVTLKKDIERLGMHIDNIPYEAGLTSAKEDRIFDLKQEAQALISRAESETADQGSLERIQIRLNQILADITEIKRRVENIHSGVNIWFGDTLIARGKGGRPDDAMIHSLNKFESLQAPGGIDLNAAKIDMKKTGSGIEIKFDPAMIERFKMGNFNGIMPVITGITPIANIYPLLGLKEPVQTAV